MPTTAIPERLKLTYEDYELLPADDRRHEIIDGEHFVTPAPGARHRAVVLNLALALGNFIKSRRLGRLFVAPFDLVLSGHDVVQPDLLYFSNQRRSAVTPANAQGPPDLAVEVLSPATRRLDELAKRKLYERAGVAEYWTVDPDLELIKVYRAAEGAYPPPRELRAEGAAVLETPLLPGLAAEVVEMFEEWAEPASHSPSGCAGAEAGSSPGSSCRSASR